MQRTTTSATNTINVGWCVGNNPPFVFCGIRLIGLPALQVETSSASVCPFHLQDGRFTVSTQHHQRFHCASWSTARVDVSFLLRCQGSRPVPWGHCNSTCGRSFLRPKFLGPKATHQLASPFSLERQQGNKNFYAIVS